MTWLRKVAGVFEWDEKRDPTQAPEEQRKRPWHMLGRRDREVLDALAGQDWLHEDRLRDQLGRDRVSFFVATIRMVQAGWIEARPAQGSFFKSEYRLNPEMW